jgi:hypothetical protein
MNKVTKEGQVLFDDKPLFPCKALFLSAEQAIVLQDHHAGKYKRIGIATFHNAKVVEADKIPSPDGAVQQVVLV